MRRGQKHIPETIEKMKLAKINISIETREKLSKAHKGKRTGKENPNWKGKWSRTNGYTYVTIAPGVTIQEHRLVAEKKIGRKLSKNEVVHHINENKQDNRPENLRVMQKEEHLRHHYKPRLFVSMEERERIRNSLLGYKHTDETKEKMRKSQIGRRHSPETLEKMSKSAIGRKKFDGKWVREEPLD